jgi:hypothetical protein
MMKKGLRIQGSKIIIFNLKSETCGIEPELFHLDKIFLKAGQSYFSRQDAEGIILLHSQRLGASARVIFFFGSS